MNDLPYQEKREYVRAPLWADVEFTPVREDEYEVLRRSEEQPRGRVISRPALSSGQAGQYEADATFQSNLVDFLIYIDEKLDRVLRLLLSSASGFKAPDCKDNKGNDGLIVGNGSDISGAGMSVICDEALVPGQLLKASFMISRFPVIPLLLFTRVVRVMPAQEGDRQRYQVVVEFIDLDEQDREKIIAYTFQVQRDTIRKEKKGNNE
jgi:hypothetical protein